MAKDYDVLFFLAADDVRKEDNGKDIIIGVYNESMIVPTIPAALPTFTLWFQTKIRKLHFEKIKAHINDPSDKELVRIEGTIQFDNLIFPATFSLKVSPLLLSAFGIYSVFLGMDSEEEKVGQFEVLSPEQFASRKVNPRG